MTVKELIKELLEGDMDDEVECCECHGVIVFQTGGEERIIRAND